MDERPAAAPATGLVKCTICELSFTSASEIGAHYKASPIHPTCGRCGNCFRDMTELLQHLQAAHAEEICVCGMSVKMDELYLHYQSASCHPKCPACNAAFKDDAGLLTTSPIAQPVKTKEELKKEKKEKKAMRAVQMQKNRCEYCNKGFTKKKGLKKHNHKTSLHPCCTLCDVGFALYKDYTAHMAAKHPSAMVLPPLPPRLSVPVSAVAGSSTTAVRTESESRDMRSKPEEEEEEEVFPFSCSELVGQRIESNGGSSASVPDREGADVHAPILDTSPSILEANNEGGPLAQFEPTSAEYRANSMVVTLADELQVHASEVDDKDDAESTISLESLRSISSTSIEEENLPVRRPQAEAHLNSFLEEVGPAVNEKAVQCEVSDEIEEDDFEHVEAAERSPDGGDRKMQSRPDSVISYITAIDSNPDRDHYVGSTATLDDHGVHQVPASPNAPSLSLSDGERDQRDHGLSTGPSSTRSSSIGFPSTEYEAALRLVSRRPLEAMLGSEASDIHSVRSAPGCSSASSMTEEEVSSVTESTATTAANGQSVPATSNAAVTTSQVRPQAPGPSWHCRSCGKDPCEEPTATQCGHIFCYSCIVKEIAEKMHCPVCHKLFLLRLNVSP
ncbi:uncharacterized protein C8Q71DRAFT_724729 [Rhodofomes roseus]|uniref:RING-type domain-containing protein n=1 Tax=Rhodofomes roseus TaxID=34475 RepID=A0ABQ8KD56_9APHY|nr:uncharacterized protein C8Q71DRAFT_724729 [Rhodofomes roseus]KAH9835431.1 hypothetical protein C8Q71DRAFT_724729 [Rhodofomes roseus]